MTANNALYDQLWMRQEHTYVSGLGLLAIRSSVRTPVTDQTKVTQCWYAWALYLYSLLLGLVSSCLVVCPYFLDIGSKHCTLAEFYHGHRDRRSAVISRPWNPI